MDLSVTIKSLKGTQMAAKITGTFMVSNNTFPFTAIAFGRIGGHNIGAKISKSTEKELQKLGFDTNEIIDELQKSLIQGNITLPEGLDKESFVDD
jgi:hypothetical protein